METMDRKDSRRESVREKLKRISKPDTTWIKKAHKRAGLPEEGKTYECYDNGYNIHLLNK